jgi:hypothetical protein
MNIKKINTGLTHSLLLGSEVAVDDNSYNIRQKVSNLKWLP